MHIFLTGAIGIGKSTILSYVEQQINVKKGGFRTIGDRDKIGKSTYVYIYNVGNVRQNSEDKGIVVAHRYGDGRYKAYPEIFNTVGVEYLNKGKGAELIIMDELGFMENDAYVFQEKVIEILDGQIPVIGVIKPRDTEFLNRVRKHKNVKVYEVTLQNRNELKEEILECFFGRKNP